MLHAFFGPKPNEPPRRRVRSPTSKNQRRRRNQPSTPPNGPSAFAPPVRRWPSVSALGASSLSNAGQRARLSPGRRVRTRSCACRTRSNRFNAAVSTDSSVASGDGDSCVLCLDPPSFETSLATTPVTPIGRSGIKIRATRPAHRRCCQGARRRRRLRGSWAG